MSDDLSFEKKGVISRQSQEWLAKKKGLIKEDKPVSKPAPEPKSKPLVVKEPHIKGTDGRRNNGAVKGISRGQGRKPKAKEEEIKNFALGSMKKAFGSEKKAWDALADMSKESFAHLRLLWEYKYGKPKEQKDLNIKQEVNIPIISFLPPEKENTIEIEATEIKNTDGNTNPKS